MRKTEITWATKLSGGGLALLAVLSACNAGNSRSPEGRIWYNIYGGACGQGKPLPGCDFFANGQKVIDNQDPSYYSSYNLSYGNWSYYDPANNNQYTTYYGYAWQSPSTGIIYDDNGAALNSKKSARGRDLEEASAEDVEKTVVLVGEKFAKAHGLAKADGVEFSRTLEEWNFIGKSRSRTIEDAKQFAGKLFKVDGEKVFPALDAAKKGDTTQIEALNVEFADGLHTTPDNTRGLLKKWFKEEAGDYNVK